MKSSLTLAVLIFKRSSKWHPLGFLLQVETMLTDVHRLALFPQSLKCTHNLLGSTCAKNTQPSWWLIYFIAWERQGFPPVPLFIKLGHLVTFASWFKPQQSQENSFPMRRTGRRRKRKRKEQKKTGERSVVGSVVQKIVFIECCVAHISCRHR